MVRLGLFGFPLPADTSVFKRVEIRRAVAVMEEVGPWAGLCFFEEIEINFPPHPLAKAFLWMGVIADEPFDPHAPLIGMSGIVRCKKCQNHHLPSTPEPQRNVKSIAGNACRNQDNAGNHLRRFGQSGGQLPRRGAW